MKYKSTKISQAFQLLVLVSAMYFVMQCFMRGLNSGHFFGFGISILIVLIEQVLFFKMKVYSLESTRIHWMIMLLMHIILIGISLTMPVFIGPSMIVDVAPID